MSSAHSLVREAFSRADIQINGSQPWDIQVHDERFYGRLIAHGSLGLGESYMDGWWDATEVDSLIYRILRANLNKELKINLDLVLQYLKGTFLNLQRLHAFEVGERHYDLGNDLYAAMLDPRLTYTCGYWKDAETLAQAQEAKLDLVCRKVGLKSSTHVLDIGSGWGSFLNFAAEKYDARGTGISVSKEQVTLANQMRFNDSVETKLQDYATLSGQFDHIVSIGMFEHVGYKNYRMFMEKAHELLSDDGYLLLHTIGGNKSHTAGDPWSMKYIFPHGMLPSITQIGSAVEGLFVMEDWHNFGADYDLTLKAWFANFDAAWPSLKNRYGERFYRMWKYYLLSFAGSFRARHIQLWQIVLSKKGTVHGYRSVR